MERSIASSLCRFKVSDEDLITDKLVKKEIAKAFDEARSFEFYIDRFIVDQLKNGDPIELYREKLFDIRNSMIDKLVSDDQNARTRFFSDARLSSRLMAALAFIHRAVAEGDFNTVYDRRIIIIKEKPGIPTIYHVSKETTVIAHVGQGPPWQEISSIYLGLKTFDALTAEARKGQTQLFNAFKMVLDIEERAIETGYTHAAKYPPEASLALNFFVDEVIKNATQFELEEKVAPEEVTEKKIKPFSDTNRKSILRDLDCR